MTSASATPPSAIEHERENRDRCLLVGDRAGGILDAVQLLERSKAGAWRAFVLIEVPFVWGAGLAADSFARVAADCDDAAQYELSSVLNGAPALVGGRCVSRDVVRQVIVSAEEFDANLLVVAHDRRARRDKLAHRLAKRLSQPVVTLDELR